MTFTSPSSLTVIFLILILVHLREITPANAQQLKVMTYNIRYDNPSDGINAWSNRKVKLCGLINKESADLLGIQEALLNQMHDLEVLLPDYGFAGAGRDDGKEKGEFAALFYKKSRFTYLDGNSFWLSETPGIPGSRGWDAACTRIVSWVKLQDKADRKTVFHFNTHFDHVGKKARKESAVLLKKMISEIAGDQAVVVTGDFNCPSDSKPLRILTSGCPCLRNGFEEAPVKTGPGFSYSTFFVGENQEDIIDHIFFTSHFLPAEAHILDDQQQGCYYSDHLPVTVIFTKVE